MSITRTPATPQQRKAAANFLRAAAELCRVTLPTLPDERRSALDLVRSAGALLRAVGTVDGVGATRAVLEVQSADGMVTRELASIFANDERLTP
jgi:hypothetical protein